MLAWVWHFKPEFCVAINVFPTLTECLKKLLNVCFRCGLYNTCSSNPCLNSAPCTNTSQTSFQCSCLNGYHGNICELFEPCDVINCENGGICKSRGQGLEDFACECITGFFGRFNSYNFEL